MSMSSSPAPQPSQGTGIGASPIQGQNQQPFDSGLPTNGMGGGKSGLSDVGQAMNPALSTFGQMLNTVPGLGQALGPLTGFGGSLFGQTNGQVLPIDMFGGMSPQPTTPFPNQQQPITTGTGQLPPGFGALSPVDRSQIAPTAGIGFGPATGGIYGRDLSAAPRSGALMGGMGSYVNQPAPQAQPANRYAPPMAPGVRTARPVAQARPVARNTRSQIR